MVSAMDLANYIIYNEYCHFNDVDDNDADRKYNRYVDNMRLQMMLYFMQAQFFCIKHEPLYNDRMEAWKFGPVVPSVYDHFHAFGQIEPKSEYDWRKSLPKEIISIKEVFLDAFSDILVEYSSEELMFICKQQSPWKNSYVEGKHNEITLKAMYDEFGCKNERKIVETDRKEIKYGISNGFGKLHYL